MRFIQATLLALALACSLAVAASAASPTSGPTAYTEQLSLLQARVATIKAEIPLGQFPVGTDADGQLHSAPGSDWNSGFWSGTLWRIYDSTRSPAAKADALQATIDHLGFERTQLHDLGFMYGESSVAAYRRLCVKRTVPDCTRLKKSGVTAARTLLELSRGTGQKIIPLSAGRCSDCAPGGTEAIVDSMMNLPLLYWASDVTGNRSYRNLALRHANWVATNLERRDGSTYQAGSYLRKAKRPKVFRHTHQGISNTGVWARGQSWSIYGFALAGQEFRSKSFVRTAERNAAYVLRHLPSSDVPPWDYRAGSTAPRDVSAGVITAAGLFHLANSCAKLYNACVKRPRAWRSLAKKILSGSLARIRRDQPVGYLGEMVYRFKYRPGQPWERSAELTMGLDYALEAIDLARGR